MRERIEYIQAEGEWEALDKTVQLKVNDVIETQERLLSDDASIQTMIPTTMRGEVRHVDEQGDARIFFPARLEYGVLAERWVYQSKFNKLKRRRQVEMETSNNTTTSEPTAKSR